MEKKSFEQSLKRTEMSFGKAQDQENMINTSDPAKASNKIGDGQC